MDDVVLRERGLPSPRQNVELPAEDVRISFADIRSVVGVLLRHWRMIITVPLIALGLTYVILAFVTPLYRSQLSLLAVDPKHPANAAESHPLTNLDVDTAAMSSEVEVLLSKSIALSVVNKLGLDKDPEFVGGGPGLLDRLGLTRLLPHLLQEKAAEPGAPIDSAADTLQRRLSVERVENSYVLSVAASSADPVKAQRIAQAVGDAYLNDQLEARYDAARRATDWLSGRLADLRQRVNDDAAAIAKLKAANNLSDVGNQSNLNEQQTADLNTQLAMARADVAEKRARYEGARNITASGGNIQAIPDVMASAVVSQLRAQQAEVSRKVAQLRVQYGDRYPEVISTQSQLEDVNRQINAEVGRIVGNLQNAYSVAQQRADSLEASLKSMTGAAANSQAGVKLQDMERVADANRHLYEDFLNKFNEIDQNSTLNDSGARIISAASLPTTPSYPRRPLIFIMVTIAAGVGGVLLAFLSEYLDAGFKTTAQIEQTLGVPVVGLLPVVRTGRFRKHADRTAILQQLVKQPFARLSEAVRTTRMAAQLSDVDEPPKVLVVTSAIPGEGKSTVAMLISSSAAMSSQRTVLVDCDLRRHSVTTNFGLKGKAGLVDVLSGSVPLEEALFQVEETNVSVLPSGMKASTPADLLNSQRMRALVAELRKKFDCVVLDASPLLPVVDAAIVAKLADKLLFVIEWSRTPRTSVFEAMKQLGPDRRQYAGIVVNKVDHARLRTYGYGYGYGYTYGYYYRSLDKYYYDS